MKRRRVLALTSAGLSLAIAGCGSYERSSDGNGAGNEGGENGSGNGNGTGEDNGEKNDEENGDDAEAAFELASLDMPDEVVTGSEWSWSMTIENVGDADGTFQTSISLKTSDTEFTEVNVIELEIPASETATYESNMGRVDYLKRATYRFEALDLEHEIRSVPCSLTFGESYENPLDVVTAVRGIELQQEYTYESDGEEATQRASSGMQWAFLDFEATNESGSSESVPSASDVTLVSGDSRYIVTSISKQSGRYEDGEVQDGVTRQGWIAYEVTEDLSVSDLTVTYSGSDDYGEWAARWQSG